MDFSGKNVFITGAASGIGKAVALKFVKSGANVAILDISEGKNNDLFQQVQEMGGNCIKLIADVSDHNQMLSAFEELSKYWNKIDILFANAGINGMWSPIEDFPVEEWDRTQGINLRGTFLTFKYSIPFMKESGGSIIITSSINGTRCFTNRGATSYASSKAAQVAFGKMAALELAPYKIRVNIICPGATYTDIGSHTKHAGNDRLVRWVSFPNGIIPLTGNKWARADQVADAVIFLAGDGAAHITGAVLHIDGGSSLIM